MSLHKSASYSLPKSYSYSQFTVNEWMKAIRSPTPYRVGNARVHFKPRVLAYIAMFVFAVMILVIYFIPSTHKTRFLMDCSSDHRKDDSLDLTYPLTNPQKIPLGLKYKIALVTDLDTDSKSKDKSNIWLSYLMLGNLTITDDHSEVLIALDKEMVTLKSKISEGGRGMELSELIVFNGRLYTVDDRTGIIYEVLDNRVVPWVILPDGNGKESKGFKCEWATVKDGRMYVGGLGKEWTTVTGEVQNTNPQWVKSVGPDGDIQHHDWKDNYNALRAKTGFQMPGYMIHESGVWSSVHQRWFFLPRRASDQKYDETADERRATNLMIMANHDFTKIEYTHIGKLERTHGFSSFKFIPGTNHNVIVALKSEEDGDKKASYIMVFNIDGTIIYPEKKIGNKKFEGIEFI